MPHSNGCHKAHAISATVRRPRSVRVFLVCKRGWTHAEGHHSGDADCALLRPGGEAAAVRIVRMLRVELGSGHGMLQRVAAQLGYGTLPRRLPKTDGETRCAVR